MFEKRVQVSPEAIAQEVSGETVILDLKSEQYFSLDEIGTRIWQLIQEPINLNEVCQKLLAEFNVDEDRVRADVGRLIGDLEAEGLLTLVSDGE